MLEKKNAKTGIGTFDGIKGMCHLVVVWVHVVSHLLERFPEHQMVIGMATARRKAGVIMAIFFIISGFAFKPAKMSTCIKKQAKLLLKPYLLIMTFSILGVVGYTVFFGEKSEAVAYFVSQLAGYLLGVNRTFYINGFEIMHIGAAWFLVALFGGWVLLNGIFCLTEKIWLRNLLVGICVILGMCSTIFPYSPYCYTQALLVVGYLYIGYLIKQKDFLEKDTNKWFWIICAGIFAITLIWGKTSMSENEWKLGLFDYIGTICGALCIQKLYFEFFPSENWIAEKLEYIGRNSLWVICVHAVEMRIAWWFLLKQIIGKFVPVNTSVEIDFVVQYVMDWCIILVGIMIIQKIIVSQKRRKALKKKMERDRNT